MRRSNSRGELHLESLEGDRAILDEAMQDVAGRAEAERDMARQGGFGQDESSWCWFMQDGPRQEEFFLAEPQ